MKTIKITALIMLLLMAAGVKTASAQTDSCISNLKSASTNYELREFDITIRLLQSSLKNCNLDREDKLQAHKLLALSYIAIDNLEAADREAEAIMKINPNYTPDKFKDEPKYSALFAKFRPVPVLRVGMTTGINRTMIGVDNYYSITHANAQLAEQNSTYKEKYGFQLGVTAEYRLYKDLWVSAQGLYRVSGFEHKLANVENTTITYNEKNSYFDLPLTLKYSFLKKDFNPYVEAGTVFSFMTASLGTTSRDESKDIVDRLDYRNTYMNGWVLGLGASYKIKSFNLFLGARTNLFGGYVNKEGTRYADNVNVFKYYYIDNDFKLSNWQLNVGAAYTLAYKNVKSK